MLKYLKLPKMSLLVAVGYMDPANWATDIQMGSQFHNVSTSFCGCSFNFFHNMLLLYEYCHRNYRSHQRIQNISKT